MDWARLADYVAAARGRAGFTSQDAFAEAAGISTRTLSKLETCHPVSEVTLGRVESALGWKEGSAARVLAGGEPWEDPLAALDQYPELRQAMEHLIALTAEAARRSQQDPSGVG